ncbi:MAG TPA: hypothetical protein VF079_03965 [Sphingomicrobium sp.]
MALSPTYAAPPKPIIDLSKSPAASGQKVAPAAKPESGIAGIDERTLEFGGGAIALLALGAGAVVISRSRRRRREEAAWQEADAGAEEHDPLFDEPMFQHEPSATEASASGTAQPCEQPSDDGSDRCPGETWVERARRGPSPANPSESLKQRLSRAAFFDKREREVAAGQAEPVEPDAGLPEAMVEEREEA